MNIIILAAGKGCRMNSDLPKVLQPLSGKPLIAHVVDTAIKLSPKRIIFVLGHKGNQIKNFLEELLDGFFLKTKKIAIYFVTQFSQLGTGDAVYQALSCVDNAFKTLILYGDVPLVTAETLKRLISVTQNNAIGILTAFVKDPSGYGRIIRGGALEEKLLGSQQLFDAHKNLYQNTVTPAINRIVEDSELDQEARNIKEINTGIFLVDSKKLIRWIEQLISTPLKKRKEFYLTDIILLATTEGVVPSSTHPDHAFEALGINTVRQLVEIERLFQNFQAEVLLGRGVKLADPYRIDIRGSVERLICFSDVFIDINCVFLLNGGPIVLGKGVVIGPNCILEGPLTLDSEVYFDSHVKIKDSYVGSKSTVLSFSLIDSAFIEENVRLGPFAHLRPGSRLGKEVRVGNFVELKNTKIGRASKVNHLSYLGDAHIGSDVNIGAGVITCNYDGKKKSPTVIGDSAFVGSGTELIAPIKVGEKAFLGAGTTLTKNAPPGQLTLSRIRQKTLKKINKT